MNSPIAMTEAAKTHVLVVDDDQQIRMMLTRFLRDNGLRVTPAADGSGMMEALESGKFDIIILDVMMPGQDGFSLCRQLRGGDQIPIVLLTAKDDPIDRIVGLEIGADDYVIKPFNPRELLARIRAVLRRVRPSVDSPRLNAPTAYSFAGWRLETVRRALISPAGALVELTSGEFDLLFAFLCRPCRVLSRDQLLDLTQGRTGALFDRSIDMQISRLRRKIENDPQSPEIIKTVRGGGYLLAAEVSWPAVCET